MKTRVEMPAFEKAAHNGEAPAPARLYAYAGMRIRTGHEWTFNRG